MKKEIKEPVFAARARFDYYNSRSHRNPPFMEKALVEISALQKSPKHAKEVIWAKAKLLRGLGRYAEAIKAYKSANRQPDSTWGVVDCWVSLKQYAKAIKSAQGLQAVGGDVASRACMRVADMSESVSNSVFPTISPAPSET